MKQLSWAFCLLCRWSSISILLLCSVDSDFARQITKKQIRQATMDRLVSRREEDIQNFVQFITKDSVQKALGFYLEQLKNKQKKK